MPEPAVSDPPARPADTPVTAGVPHGQPVLDRLIRLLDLERIEENIYRGSSPKSSPIRVFGGQVAGQALVAAGRTVTPQRRVHSLHAYFIRPGDPSVPIVYEVDRIRDGKSFATRRVVAIQHGRAIFSMSVSFHAEEEGLEHQMPMPDVPHPDSLPTDAELKEKILPQLPEPVRRYYERPRPIELRPIEFGRYSGKAPKDGRFNIWMRTTA